MFSFESQKKLWLQYFEEINKTGRLEGGPYIKETAIEKFFVDEDVKKNDLSGREIRNGIPSPTVAMCMQIMLMKKSFQASNQICQA